MLEEFYLHLPAPGLYIDLSLYFISSQINYMFMTDGMSGKIKEKLFRSCKFLYRSFLYSSTVLIGFRMWIYLLPFKRYSRNILITSLHTEE